MAWITTPLNAGSIPANTYDYTIPSLSASTVYEYRAYMVVSGTPYYGNILTGTTLPIPLSIPTVITSGITLITTTGATGGGFVASDGNSTVIARGLAYGLSANPTIAGAHTHNGSGLGSFSGLTTGLTPSTTYNVRAYATNTIGTGYGSQEFFVTATPPPTPVIVDIYENYNHVYESGGDICITPPLTAGQWVTISLNYNQTALGSGSLEQICMWCKTIAYPFYVDISADIDPSCKLCTDEYRYCGYAGGQITINYGDSICWSNHANGNIDSCSSFCINSYVGSSPDVNPSIGTNYCNGVCIVSP
jgi:hypothetical protein